MKKIVFALFIVAFFTQCKKAEPTAFDQNALQDKVFNLAGQEQTLGGTFNSYKGQVVLIDIWASWCKDCLASIPQMKTLKAKYGESVTFLYLSMDKEQDVWKNAIEKLEITGEHYYMGKDWKTTFNQSITLNWIPRFMILDKEGNIALYNAEKIDDPRIEETLQTLLKSNK